MRMIPMSYNTRSVQLKYNVSYFLEWNPSTYQQLLNNVPASVVEQRNGYWEKKAGFSSRQNMRSSPYFKRSARALDCLAVQL